MLSVNQILRPKSLNKLICVCGNSGKSDKLTEISPPKSLSFYNISYLLAAASTALCITTGDASHPGNLSWHQYEEG